MRRQPKPGPQHESSDVQSRLVLAARCAVAEGHQQPDRSLHPISCPWHSGLSRGLKPFAPLSVFCRKRYSRDEKASLQAQTIRLILVRNRPPFLISRSSFQEMWEICDLPVGDRGLDQRDTSFQVHEFVAQSAIRPIHAAPCTGADASFSTNWPSWKCWPLSNGTYPLARADLPYRRVPGADRAPGPGRIRSSSGETGSPHSEQATLGMNGLPHRSCSKMTGGPPRGVAQRSPQAVRAAKIGASSRPA